jgi:hypothetical protein
MKMNSRLRQAEQLMALASLGAPHGATPVIRLDGGALDKALLALEGKLPGPLSHLTFSVTAVGLRCLELPEIENAALHMLAAEHDRGDHNRLRAKIGRDEARQLALESGSTIAEWERIGRMLMAEVSAAA